MRASSAALIVAAAFLLGACTKASLPKTEWSTPASATEPWTLSLTPGGHPHAGAALPLRMQFASTERGPQRAEDLGGPLAVVAVDESLGDVQWLPTHPGGRPYTFESSFAPRFGGTYRLFAFAEADGRGPLPLAFAPLEVRGDRGELDRLEQTEARGKDLQVTFGPENATREAGRDARATLTLRNDAGQPIRASAVTILAVGENGDGFATAATKSDNEPGVWYATLRYPQPGFHVVVARIRFAKTEEYALFGVTAVPPAPRQ